MVRLDASAGCRYLFPERWAATSDRMDAFLALIPKFFRAEAVAVVGLKMEMYASISACGGASFCYHLSYRAFQMAGPAGLLMRLSTYHGAVFVAIPGMQTVNVTEVDDMLDLTQLHHGRSIISVIVIFAQPEKHSTCAVKVV
jgi:hypothetical protein